MKNTPVGKYESEEIRAIVARVLRDVGAAEPPLNLEAVRDKLELDLRYYNINDPSLRREMVHGVRVGTKLLARKVARSLREVAEKAKLWGLWLPKRKRILISEDAPKRKHRWIQSHEIGHSLIPHHARYLFGDPEQTLSLSCHAELEREANYAAGQLTFLQGRFTAEACACPVSLKAVLALASAFGNSRTSTLWRFVEEAHKGVPLVGVVSPNPWSTDVDPCDPCRYCIESPVFRERFGAVSEVELFGALRSYCSHKRGGPLGEGEVMLVDGNDEHHMFFFESWSNTYEVLSLGVYRSPVRTAVRIPRSIRA